MLSPSSDEHKKLIAPFIWCAHEGSASVILCPDRSPFQHYFAARAAEGFEGSGYDWASIADVFVADAASLADPPLWAGLIKMDPEADMFSAYADDAEALQLFVEAFRRACDDAAVMESLVARAELD